MITKNTSKSFKKLSYLVVIPVCIICIMAFAPAGVMNKKFVSSNTSFLHIKPSPPKLFPVKNGTKGDITATFGRKQQHPNTQSETSVKKLQKNTTKRKQENTKSKHKIRITPKKQQKTTKNKNTFFYKNNRIF